MADPTITLMIRANAGQLVGEVKLSSAELAKLGAFGRDAGKTASAGLDAATRSTQALGAASVAAGTASRRSHRDIAVGIESISTQLARAQRLYAAWLGAVQVGQAVAGLGRMADAYTNISSKIRNVTSSESELARAREQALAIAQRTRADFESTVELYTRLTRATASLGVSQADNLRITETINKAFVVSGASAQEASAAITQLAQGLSAGALRGDEFNSVAEQAPILMDLLGQALNMTRGELRAYAAEGKLSAEIVTRALLEGGASVDAQFAKMAPTIAGSMTQVRNSFVAFVGEFSAVASTVASGISLLANNLGGVLSTAMLLGIAHLAKLVTSLVVQQVASARSAAATAALAVEELNAARTAEAEAAAIVNGMRAKAAAGLATTELASAEAALAAAQMRTIAATEAATAAGVARAGMLARLGSGLLALVGGPVGAGVLAFGALAAAIYQTYQREQERIAEFERGIASMQDATKATLELARARAQLDAAQPRPLADVAAREATNMELLAKKQEEYNSARERLVAIEERMRPALGAMARDAQVMQLGRWVEEAKQARAELARLDEEMGRLRNATSQLTAEMRDRFVAFLVRDLPAAAKDAANALREVWAAAKGGNLAGATRGLVGALDDVLKQARQRFLEADKAGVDAFAAIGAGAGEARAALEDYGKSQAELTQEIVDAKIAAIEHARMAPEVIAAARAEGAAWVASVAALEKRKKAVVQNADAGADLVRKLKEEVATYGLAGTDLDRYRVSITQMTDAQRKAAWDAIDLKEALEETGRAAEEARKGLATLGDINQRLAVSLENMEAEITGADAAQIAFNQTLREAQAAYLAAGEEGANAYKEAVERANQVLARTRDLEAHREALRAHDEELRRSQQLWGDWADAIFDAVTRSGNFLKNLLQNVKQIVAQILAEWFRTSVVGLFAGGGGWGGLAMGAAGQAMGLGGGVASAGGVGGVGGFGGAGFNFMSPTSWLNAGKSLWAGFSGAGNIGGGSTMFGSYYGQGFMGPLPAGAQYGFTPTALGWGVAAAGGAWAGYNRYRNTEGGLAGIAGGAAYGVGTTAVGLGAMGAMAGGMSGAMAGLGALGPIGWVAIAAMLVDMLSGGKLFGTKFRPNDLKQDIGVGPEGGWAALTMGQVRQGALFSGREWRDVGMDVPPELMEAAERFFKSVQRVMTDGARQLAIDVPPMIEASIRTLQEFDKKGNVTATKYFVDAVGRTWEEASAELAAQRVGAEALIATIAASEAGKMASQIAEQWRYDAEVLADGAAMMLAATTDIVRGRGLLMHGTGLSTMGGGSQVAPGTPGVGGTGPGEGPGNGLAQVMVKVGEAADDAADMLERTVAVVQELQRGEESLAETYARLVADANLLQQALDLAGVTLDKTSEDFVRFADGIEQAAGGLEQAQALWQGFFQAYYSAAELSANQLLALQTESATALAGIGLEATTGMAELRRQFEDTLPEMTPEEVVQWLQAADALARLTQAQAELESQVAAILGPMGLAGQGLSLFGQALLGIQQQGAAAIDAANALARSRGAEGASAVQLAAIHQWTASQIAAAVRQLQAETQRLIADLYGDVPGSLDAINQRIAELEQGATGAIDSIGSASDDLFARWQRGIESVQDYLDSMLLGDLSALTPEEQIAEAQRQLVAMQQAAMGGDADALAKLPQLADAFLRLARGAQVSGSDYNATFDWVRQLLQATTDLPNPGTAPGTGAGGSVELVPSAELRELYAARDAALADQEAEYRRGLAEQLAQHLADWAAVLGVPVLDLIDAQQVSLAQLAADLGVNLNDLTAQTVAALGNMAVTLGVPLGTLADQLGVSLPDLRTGLTELATSVGIDLSAVTTTTVAQLAALSTSLGSNLHDLGVALGIDLGRLADADSPIFRAMEEAIGALAPDIQGELAPLLDAVREAAGDEQANSAVRALRDHVDALAPGLRDQLAPFFEDIFPSRALDQLDMLSEIRSIAADQLGALGLIRDNLKAANAAAGIPSYAVGTGYVPRTGPATLHEGEIVIPAPFADWMRREGLPTSSASDGALVAEVRALRAEVAELRRTTDNGAGRVAEAVQRQGEAAQSQRADISRALQGPTARSFYG